MRRFQFKLERLLSIRKYREREWELKLAEAAGKVAVLNRNIEGLKREKNRVFMDRDFAAGPDMAYMMTLSSLYMKRIGEEINDLSVKLEEAELIQREIREGYMEASKERKSIDKLKEKRSVEFYKAQEIADMKSLDDINTASFIRKAKPSEDVGTEAILKDGTA